MRSTSGDVRNATAVLVLIALQFVSLGSRAEELAPDALIQQVTNDVLQIIKTDSDIQHGDVRKAVQLIEARVLPNFDFERMTALAAGKYWRAASCEQRRILTEKFKTLLVRTYANALTSYRGQTVEFRPSKGSTADTEVLVRSEIKQAGVKPISMDYSLEKSGPGWKVFDVSIAGISLVMNYRSQFAELVRNGGIDGLISALDSRNRS